MSRDWLLLRLSGPMMSFGGEAIDQFGPTRDFPAASMLTGLFANALGWHWREGERLQRLQDRLVFGAAILREGRLLTDTQNAQLGKNDRGWTTRGAAEGRAGASYGAPHRRWREYLQDAEVLIALRLDPAEEAPDLSAIADALDRPARPLFLGRKSCLPSGRIVAGNVRAANAATALAQVASGARAIWPKDEGPDGDRIAPLTDQRNWVTGLHGGQRLVVEGRLP